VSRAHATFLLAAGLALGAFAYRIQTHDLLATTPARSAAQVAAGWAFLAAGLALWARRPENRMGPLLVVTSFALLARQFRYSHDALAFTTFFAFGEIGYALFAHCVLAYPSGVVRDRFERAFLALAYATTIVFPLATLLVYDGSRPLRWFDRTRPRESLLLVHGDGNLARLLQDTYAVIALGFLASALIVLLVRKFVRATPRARRTMAPLLLAAVVVALRAVLESILTFADRPPAALTRNLFWWQIVGLAAVPLALLVGLLRSRLAQARVGDLARRLEHTPPEQFASTLGNALHDPSLEVAFWLPEQRRYVDAGGAPVTLPTDASRRAITLLEHDGAPVAALMYDPALRDDPNVVEAAAAAARLALENARLHAELRAQLAVVQESRRRIVEAADEERRRIERNLHDGAQQALLAVALELRSALRRYGGRIDSEVEQALETAVGGLQEAVDELRELAHGVHPAVLTEQGLAAALESLADRMPVTVTVTAAPTERLPAPVEAAAYYVACEAVTNAAKHAGASRVTVEAQRSNGTLRVQVADDGVGGADATGSGLRGLSDRVEARGGRLDVRSGNGGGTTVVAEIPCAS